MKRNRSAVLQTERLSLRAIASGDADDFIALLTDPEVKKTYMVPDFASRSEAEKLFARIREMSASGEHFVYGIYLQDQAIGLLNYVDRRDKAIELGYVIAPCRKNNGFATEALAAAIRELFDMGYETVRAGAFEENLASRRVMEKCAMVRTGRDEEITYRGRTHRCINYEIKNPVG